MSTCADAIDLDVFRRYVGLSLPRHVSYPMPTAWHDIDAAEAASMQCEVRERAPGRDLSLYVHIPFCEQLCRYCACTRIVRHKSAPAAARRTEAYVAALRQEIDTLADSVGTHNRVRQIHWGGGTPIYLATDEIRRVQEAITGAFSVSSDAEIAMELDPRRTTVSILEALRRFGFNRISFGVQDFNPQVQEHVHRIQPLEMIREKVAASRELGFASINFDLIYGLPYQTAETMRKTIEQTVELAPDRIAYYHYAQIPERVATQRGLDYGKLPDSEAKLEMFLAALERFEAAGYVFIGLDHFAKPDEPLALALREGTLQRNFQGMSTGGGLDLIGVGATSISHLTDVGFLQNVHDPDEYTTCVRDGSSPIRRGKRFSFDDRIRQAVMTQLYCTAEIRPGAIEKQFDVVFSDYFARELEIMRELERDGLVLCGEDGGVSVTLPLGRVLIRNVAGVFDAYLEPDAYRVGDRRCFSANA